MRLTRYTQSAIAYSKADISIHKVTKTNVFLLGERGRIVLQYFSLVGQRLIPPRAQNVVAGWANHIEPQGGTRRSHPYGCCKVSLHNTIVRIVKLILRPQRLPALVKKREEPQSTIRPLA